MLRDQVQRNKDNKKNRGKNNHGFNLDEKTKRDDTFDRFFAGFSQEDAAKFIKKSEVIDESFADHVRGIRPYRQDMHKEKLNDKLFMFSEVEKVSHDPKLQKEMKIMFKRLKEMQRFQG